MEKKNKKSRLWVNVLGIPLLLSCIYFGDTEIVFRHSEFPLFSLFIYIVMHLSMIEWLDLIGVKSLNLRAINASYLVCTSTITDIFNFKASLYISSAILSVTPAMIINIASAP